MNVSLIIPSRDNLKYLKWSYASIRKNQGRHNVEICVADDFSSDGTWAWCTEREKEDPNFKWIRNMGPTRVGHTILYDRLVKECASHEICIIYHADMYLCPGALDAIEEILWQPSIYTKEQKAKGGLLRAGMERFGTIVSLTRIEPPLHPDGPEKVLWDLGTEPENFKEKELLYYFGPNLGVSPMDKKMGQNKLSESTTLVTKGVFAPWAFYKRDFLEVGGHDPLFAPQSKEDSDIFNRFKLNGVKFIQTWKGFVYHMTCRGSRFNPTITEVGKNSDEWTLQNLISSRNFIRKWGSFIAHDEYMMPIVPPKYNVLVALKGSMPPEAYGGVCAILEPWCSTLIADIPEKTIRDYITVEQPTTPFSIKDRVLTWQSNEMPEIHPEVYLEGEVGKIAQAEIGYLQQINSIIENYIKTEKPAYPVTGSFSLGNWMVSLNIAKEPDMKAMITNVQDVNWKTKSIYSK